MASADPYANCKKKVYEYSAPWQVYSLAWSNAIVPSNFFRLAVGSYIERYENSVHVIQLDPDTDEFKLTATVKHAYPTTQIQWAPEGVGLEGKDILATVGDYLRLWEIPTDLSAATGESISRPQHLFDANKQKNSCTPLTNMDWNSAAKNIIGVCCIDPICTIWDIEAGKIQSKILAHGHSSVFDLQFKPASPSIFGSVGADGSLRLFDLRNLQHSAIVFETDNSKPLLRLDWNCQSSEKIAVLDVDGQEVNIIDIRNPMKPVHKLKRHLFPVNSISWAPHSEVHIATAGEDMNAFIWNLDSSRFADSGDPLLEYCAKGCINNMIWSKTQPDWLSIGYDRSVQILLV